MVHVYEILSVNSKLLPYFGSAIRLSLKYAVLFYYENEKLHASVKTFRTFIERLKDTLIGRYFTY